MAVKTKPGRKEPAPDSASAIEKFLRLPENVARRRFNVEEYYRMAEVGILGEDDYVELIEGHIIDKSSQPIARRRFTVEEYYRMAEAGILKEDDRVELIEGEIIQMSPKGSLHAGCIKRLIKLLNGHIGKNVLLSVQDPVKLDGLSHPEPDIALLKHRNDFYAQGHPTPTDVLLLIEVADTSVNYDRADKVPLYARSGIPEVWLVNLPDEAIEVYARPEKGEYQTQVVLKRGETIVSPTIPGLSFKVENVLG